MALSLSSAARDSLPSITLTLGRGQPGPSFPKRPTEVASPPRTLLPHCCRTVTCSSPQPEDQNHLAALIPVRLPTFLSSMEQISFLNPQFPTPPSMLVSKLIY